MKDDAKGLPTRSMAEDASVEGQVTNVVHERGALSDFAEVSDQVVFQAGDTIGRYVVEQRLGAGAMGVVYAAHDPKLDRRVAVKLLRARGGEGSGSHVSAPRLLREARAMARLGHPNVVAVHDVGELGERVFVAMELVDGGTLRNWLAEKHQSWRQALTVCMMAGRGLAAAHAAGIVHCDFKPDNVLVSRSGEVRVTDFGLARSEDSMAPARGDTATPDGAPTSPLATTIETAKGTLLGTPGYMSPEQMLSEPATVRSDVFSFCVTVYEALYGHRPFEGSTLLSLCESVTKGRVVPRGARAPLPAGIRRVLMRGLRARPEERYASIDAVLADLDRAAKRSRLGAAAVASAALVIAGVVATVVHPARRSVLDPPPASAKQVPSPPGLGTRPMSLRVANPTRLTFGNGCEEFPSFTPNGESIVYDGTVGGDSYVFRLDLRGGPARQLTQVDGWDMAAAISPAGDHIAFLRFEGEHIGTWVAPLDGREAPHRIAAGSVRPSWSRDGKGVWAGSGAPISKYDADTGALLTALTSVPSTAAGRTAELPDGSLLILFNGLGTQSQKGIAVFDPRGAMRWLSQENFEEVFDLTRDARHVITMRSMSTGTYELLDMPVDGSPPASLSSSGIQARKGLTLAPDEKHVAWSTCTAYADTPTTDVSGRLSDPIGDVEAGDWSSMSGIPGTSLLAVVSSRAGKAQPWVHDVAGRTPPRAISIGDLSAHEISVSFDGRQFVLSVNDKGLYVGNLGGSDPQLRQLTSDPRDSRPSFSSDGAQILFTRQLADSKPEVFTVPTSGGEAVPLLPPGSDDGVCAPIGDRIAYLAGDSVSDATPMIRNGRTGVSQPLSPGLERGRYTGLRFSPDGRRIALARGDAEIIELDARTGTRLRTIQNPRGYQLSQPTYTAGGLVVTRIRWQGNIWIADAVLQE
jgi:Tol biopolymer transport system component